MASHEAFPTQQHNNACGCLFATYIGYKGGMLYFCISTYVLYTLYI